MNRDRPDGPDGPDRRDRSGRLDLRAWAVPPVPTALADRVLERVERDQRAAPATAAEPPSSRRAWARYLAIAAGGAAVAAAVTWWLASERRAAAPAGRAAIADGALDLGDGVTAIASPGALVRWQRVAGDRADPRPELHVVQSSGVVDYRTRGDVHLRLTTPLAAIDAGPGPARLAVTPLAEEKPVNRTALAVGGAAALAAGLAVVVYQGRAEVQPTAGPARTLDAGQQVTLPPPATRPPTWPAPVAKATRDRGLRDQLVTAIADARARRAALPAASPAGASDAATLAVGARTPEDAELPLSKQEIRGAIRELVPMLADCYDQELVDHSLAVGGTLVAHLVVETEPDLGTVVSMNDQQPSEVDFELAVDDGPGPAAAMFKERLAAFTQCVDATLESAVMPPMKRDGRLEITYPFTFAPIDGEGDDDDGRTVGSGSGSGSGSDARPAGTAPRPAAPTPPSPPPSSSPRVAPPATPAPAVASAAELVGDAQAAAASMLYARALSLAEQALVAPGLDDALRARATTLAGLAACNTRNRAKAQRFFDLAPAHRRMLLRQACLKHGFDPGALTP